jgi:predicted phage baseplate assembly protein
MPLEAPILDDRSYEQIKALVRSRIPRYTPEWTDFNESDPGITLIELFSWLSEMMLFQMNRIPDRNYIKFLKLLNLELRSPTPSVAHLTFIPKEGAQVLPVSKRTQVAAQSAETGELIIFETDEGLDLIPYAMSDVQVYDGAAFTVLTDANNVPATRYRPLGWTPQLGSALYLGFTPPDPLPAVGQRVFPQQLRFRVFLPASSQAGEAQSCADVAQPPVSPVNLVWEYRHPKDLQRWRRLNLYKDDTAGFTREGYILLEGPADVAVTTEGKLNEEARYWIRCRLDSGVYPAGRAPEIDFLRSNTVSAQSLSSVHEEIIGQSEGHPNQRFDLRRAPVLQDSLTLRVEVQDRETEIWIRVDDFLASASEDPHYTLNPTSGELRFGDGRRGRVPVAGASLIATEYRYGGGRDANVGVDSITIPLSSLVGVDSVTNTRAAVGGSDEQDIEDLKVEAPSVLRHRNRSVTAEDFAAIVQNLGDVAKAVAIPLAHPEYPGVKVPGAVTVVIVPDSEDQPPKPSSDQIRYACNYLDGFRLLTTEVYVKGPVYQAVKVIATIAAKPYAAFDEVALTVAEQLNQRLDPMNWPFGRELYPTSLYDVILGIEGVSAVPFLSLEIDGVPHDDFRMPVKVTPDGLLYGLDHEITVVPEENL